MLLIFAVACIEPVDDVTDSVTDTVDDFDDEEIPLVDADWTGSYALSQTWKLHGPVHAERTFGDVASELIVSKTVSRVGVPAPCRESLRIC